MNLFGDNLRRLRKANGDTQVSLATALFLTQNAISQYEAGKHTPDHEIIARIAKHYGVSPEALLCEDLSWLTPSNLKLSNSIEGRKTQLKALFPICKSEEAMRNADFVSAFEKHCGFRNFLINPDLTESDAEKVLDWIDDIFDRYEVAATSGIVEAKANIISWFFLLYLIALDEILFECLGEDFSPIDDLPRYLSEYRRAQSNKRSDDRVEFFYEFVKSSIFGYIHDLKVSGKYADLADYFTMLLFQYALVREDIDTMKSYEIAGELMQLGIKMENRYICRCYLQIVKMLHKD